VGWLGSLYGTIYNAKSILAMRAVVRGPNIGVNWQKRKVLEIAFLGKKVPPPPCWRGPCTHYHFRIRARYLDQRKQYSSRVSWYSRVSFYKVLRLIGADGMVHHTTHREPFVVSIQQSQLSEQDDPIWSIFTLPRTSNTSYKPVVICKRIHACNKRISQANTSLVGSLFYQ